MIVYDLRVMARPNGSELFYRERCCRIALWYDTYPG